MKAIRNRGSQAAAWRQQRHQCQPGVIFGIIWARRKHQQYLAARSKKSESTCPRKSENSEKSEKLVSAGIGMAIESGIIEEISSKMKIMKTMASMAENIS
jgi:hypothetical protein